MTVSQRLAAVLSALLVMGALTLASAPDSSAAVKRKVPRGYFGLGGWEFPNQGEINHFTRRGLRSWRVTMSWGDIEETRGRYQFSGYDQLIDRLIRRRIQVLITLTGCPVWACNRGGLGPPRTAAALTAWQAFVRNVVVRYGTGSRKRPVRHFQVLNEVNGEDQWPSPSAAEYAALLKSTTSTIRVADRKAKVLTAGFGEKMTIWLRSYLRTLYRQPGFKGDFDILAVEGYAVRPRHIRRIIRTTLRTMRRARDRRRRIWITEMSWATGPRFPRHAFVTTPRKQARYLRNSFDLLLSCRKRWRVQRTFWFPHRDRVAPAGSADYWGNHNGLIRPSGQWKPAMKTFLRYTRKRVRGKHRPKNRCRPRAKRRR